jgi:hypothetical protein
VQFAHCLANKNLRITITFSSTLVGVLLLSSIQGDAIAKAFILIRKVDHTKGWNRTRESFPIEKKWFSHSWSKILPKA